ncbi:MAG: transcription-repair coupling factor [Actinomycetota bacterium]|nr:transcription-repair coupling factor [Actinomycetota bacterium]
MASLAPLLDLLPEERVRALADGSEPLTVVEPVRPFLLAAFARHLDKPVLVVTPRVDEAEQLARDVQAFLGRDGAEVFPGWEVLPGEPVSPSVETMGRRLRVLSHLRRGRNVVVVATAQAAAQLVSSGNRGESEIGLRVGDEIDLEQLTARLVDMGYDRNYIVERRGEFAIRGGIVDVFPPGEERPVRAELWGDEISSLRRFALASQRSLDEIELVEVTPARELTTDETTQARARTLLEDHDDQALVQLAEGVLLPGAERLLPLIAGDMVTLGSLFPAGSVAAVVDPKIVSDRANDILDQLSEWERSSGVPVADHYSSVDECLAAFRRVVMLSSFRGPTPGLSEEEPASTGETHSLPAETWVASAGKPAQLIDRLRRLISDGYRAVVAASLEDTAVRLTRSLRESGLPFERAETAPGVETESGGSVVVAELGRGFVLPSARLALVAESDVTGRRSGAAGRRLQAKRRETSGPLDLSDGDLVVHEFHGIGRYRGIVERDLLGVHREYLLLEYAKGDRLYVPSDQIDLVSRYVGGEAPRLNRLGTADWSKTKSRVRSKAREIAHELVALYARRAREKGFTFGSDTPWQRELEDSFPYEETPDQLRAVDEVKDDMERPLPMDRLVCGDVGYGKTEISVRAAFKAVTAGKQVAVLVPTTILAQQHHATFVERFRHWPVRVEMLSRFLSQTESKRVVEELKGGKIDVVIGTHRLLQPDITFSDLGLVVVDEEQRFGVEQKERLKSLRANVDFLTLTATPIPRTLEMAMSGIRDMSIVDTPPENRHPVMTFVGEFSENIVSSAVRRELLRDGQVFYVHHRVETIDYAARRIQTLVPEARVGIAHGQMDERLLEQTMLDFGDKKTNVLVCTTIIESGLDIPSVNTLVVERADLLGLSQMYQLRGRVGRAHERAYAYLFFPPERSLTEGAFERLKTIASHTGLGSGFRIAMKDLEIRGAGNLLGAEQHGHISEVGFDLYVKLVASAVEEVKGTPWRESAEVRIDLPLKAFIPKTYIADENLRLEAYRRIASARDPEDLVSVRAELEDRYGPPIPEPVSALLELARLRAAMLDRGVREVSTVAGNLRIKPIELEDSRQVRLQRILPEAEWRASTRTLLIPERVLPSTDVVSWVVRVLEQLTSPS